MKQFTAVQKEWMRKFEAETGMDAMMGEYETGEKSFQECAEYNIGVFEDHAADTIASVKKALASM